MKQHKWHKEIKAWADGEEIECKYFQDDKNKWSRWMQDLIPLWHDNEHVEYRIKQQPKEPKYLYAYKDYIRDDGSTTSKIAISSTFLDTEFYIGKIKLEVEE